MGQVASFESEERWPGPDMRVCVVVVGSLKRPPRGRAGSQDTSGGGSRPQPQSWPKPGQSGRERGHRDSPASSDPGVYPGIPYSSFHSVSEETRQVMRNSCGLKEQVNGCDNGFLCSAGSPCR